MKKFSQQTWNQVTEDRATLPMGTLDVLWIGYSEYDNDLVMFFGYWEYSNSVLDSDNMDKEPIYWINNEDRSYVYDEESFAPYFWCDILQPSRSASRYAVKEFVESMSEHPMKAQKQRRITRL